MFIISLNVTILFGFLNEVELPAAQTWNPFDIYTPSLGRPRIGYHDVLNDTNYGTGIYLWTAFLPLKGRSYFTEMAIAEGD